MSNKIFFSNNKPTGVFSFTTTSSTISNTILFSKTYGEQVLNLDNEIIIAGTPINHSFTGTGITKNIDAYLGHKNSVTDITINIKTATGLLDFTDFNNLETLTINDNSNLTALTLPSSSILFNSLNATGCDIHNVDLSGLSGLGGSVKIYDNNNLTAVTNPNSSQIFTNYEVYNGDLRNIDLSGLSGLGGEFYAFGNSNLTAITNPNSSQIFTNYEVYGCDLIELDVSGLSGLGGEFYAFGNSNLTAITNPNSSQIFTKYEVYGCDLIKLDVSSLSGLGGSFQLQNQGNLTALTLPNSSQSFSNINSYNCSLGYVSFLPISASSSNNIQIYIYSNNFTSSIVNHILYDLDQINWTGGSIYIGGTNAAPDGSSGGYDGVTAKSNLISKFWTVSTS